MRSLLVILCVLFIALYGFVTRYFTVRSIIDTTSLSVAIVGLTAVLLIAGTVVIARRGGRHIVARFLGLALVMLLVELLLLRGGHYYVLRMVPPEWSLG